MTVMKRTHKSIKRSFDHVDFKSNLIKPDLRELVVDKLFIIND